MKLKTLRSCLRLSRGFSVVFFVLFYLDRQNGMRAHMGWNQTFAEIGGDGSKQYGGRGMGVMFHRRANRKAIIYIAIFHNRSYDSFDVSALKLEISFTFVFVNDSSPGVVSGNSWLWICTQSTTETATETLQPADPCSSNSYPGF